MEYPFFYFKKLTKGNLIALLSYIIISFGLYYSFKKSSPESQKLILFFYSFFTPFLLYGFAYKALRNMTYYCCWVIIALIHFYIYWHIKDDPTLFMYRGSAAVGLSSTIFALLLFQVLRFASLKIQHQELVAPNRGSRTDTYNERKINFLDIILFFIYMGALVALLLN